MKLQELPRKSEALGFCNFFHSYNARYEQKEVTIMITALLIYLIPLIILVAIIKLLVDIIKGIVRYFKKD